MSGLSNWPGPFTDEECDAVAHAALERGYMSTTVLGDDVREEDDYSDPAHPGEAATP